MDLPPIKIIQICLEDEGPMFGLDAVGNVWLAQFDRATNISVWALHIPCNRDRIINP